MDNEIELCAQNVDTILDSTMDTIGKVRVITRNENEKNLQYDHY